MKTALWMTLALTLGCGDKDQAADGISDADADADTDADCDTPLGTLSGQVIEALPWTSGEQPASNARISAMLGDEAPITILSDEDGLFSTPIMAGVYTVHAYADDGCFSEQITLDIEACSETEEILRLIECIDGGGESDTGE